MKVRASAPGKIILFGEHFVVKGAPSIATAISKRVTVTIESADNDRVVIESDRAGIKAVMSPEELEKATGVLAPLAGLIRFFREEYGIAPPSMRVSVESEIPVGAGLGSSAAFSAAFSLAYATLNGLKLGKGEVLRASSVAERIAHGNPSGIDTTIAVYGGSILYRRGSPPEPVNIKLPGQTVLLVANTGVGRSTREVVERVLGRAEMTWNVSQHIYRAAEALVSEALKAFGNGDVRLLGELMDLNQGLLNAMGASSRIIEDLVYEARSHGAIGAKLTGAGWGGSVIVLVDEDRASEVVRVLREAGAVEVFPVVIGCEGVRLEK
jgi:mevalonate kinase